MACVRLAGNPARKDWSLGSIARARVAEKRGPVLRVIDFRGGVKNRILVDRPGHHDSPPKGNTTILRSPVSLHKRFCELLQQGQREFLVVEDVEQRV